MERSVFKWEITIGRAWAPMRAGATLLYADAIPASRVTRYDPPDAPPQLRFFVWGLVDHNAPQVRRDIGVFLTGDLVPDGWQHVSSFKAKDTDGSPFLGHVFDGGER